MIDIKTKGSPVKGIVGSTIGFFIGFAGVVVIGSIVKTQGFVSVGFSPVLVGLLVASPNLSGSLLRIPFAAWSDQAGGRKPLLSLLLLSIIGLIGLGIIGYLIDAKALEADDYALILGFGFLAGCGLATFSVGISQTSYWFPQSKQGKALAVYAGLGNLAPGIFSIILAFTIPSIGAGGSYMIWLILLVGGTAIYYFIGLDAWSFQLEKQGLNFQEAEKIAREKGQEIFSTHKLKTSLITSGKVRQTWLLVGLYFTSFGGFIGLASWFPTYWSFHGLGTIPIGTINLQIALILNAIFIIIGSLMRVVSGPLSDKYSGSLITKIGALLILAGGIVMLFASVGAITVAITGMIIIAVGMGMDNAGVFKIMPKAVPKAVGGAAGWIGGLGAAGGFVIPPIMSALGYGLAFITFTILAPVSLMLVLIIEKGLQKL